MRQLIFSSFAALLLAACSDSPSPAAPGGGEDGGADAGSGDGGPDLDDGGCYAHPSPTSSFEIINACSDGGFIDKHPSYPLNLPDGGLKPLP